MIIKLGIKPALMSGVLISMAANAFLRCENKIVGAVIFTMGLFFILANNLSLFTGACGYSVKLTSLALLFVFNIAGVAIGTMVVLAASGGFYGSPVAIVKGAHTALSARLSRPLFDTFCASILCGVMMFLAVSGWKEKESDTHIAAVLFGVVGFILSGYEHSIANCAFWMLSAPVLTLSEHLQAACIVLVCAAGNLIGSKLTSWLIN